MSIHLIKKYSLIFHVILVFSNPITTNLLQKLTTAEFFSIVPPSITGQYRWKFID